MHRPTLRALSLLPMLLALSVAASLARADRAIVLSGDPAPGSGGGTFSQLGLPALNDFEHVAFRANLTGGAASEGIFLDTASGLTAIAVVGDLAPDTGGGTFFDFGEAAINDAGQVAFSARITGGAAAWALYRYDPAGLTTLATTATTAPGTGGGSYSAFGDRVSINAGGEVAFVATVGGGTTTEGVFVEDGTTGSVVFLIGDTAPAGAAGSFFDFSPPVLSDAGEVAVWASVFFDPGFTSGILVSGSPDHWVALVGESAPDTGGGTYSTFNSSAAPGLDADGNVYFRADVSAGTTARGLFVDQAGLDAAIALQGDPAPGTSGTFFLFPDLDGFSVNESGVIGHSANLLGGGAVGQGIFKSSLTTGSVDVALVGQTAPDTGGATYLILGSGASLNAFGQAAFRGSVIDGSVSNGIFLLPEPSGAAPWCATLVTLSWLRRRRLAGCVERPSRRGAGHDG